MKMQLGWSVGKGLWLLLLWAATQPAWANVEVAVVTSLAGTVSVQKLDGKMRVLAKDSILMSNEIIMTGKDSTVSLRFTDGSMTTLRPASRLAIEDYNYDASTPEKDSIVLYLLKGGLRAVTGLIGKRGNQNAYKAKTSEGTIGIRGTDYALMLCEKPEGGQDGNCTGLDAPVQGMYLTVFEGAILLVNNISETLFSAGKSFHVPNANTAPVELPSDPGLGRAFPAFGNMPGVKKSFGSAQDSCLVR